MTQITTYFPVLCTKLGDFRASARFLIFINMKYRMLINESHIKSIKFKYSLLVVRDESFKNSQPLATQVKNNFSTVMGPLDHLEKKYSLDTTSVLGGVKAISARPFLRVERRLYFCRSGRIGTVCSLK